MNAPAPARVALIPIDQIVGLLAGRIQWLARDLLPNGVRAGQEWVALNPMRSDTKQGSFSVHLGGAKAGVWADFAAGINGDALDLIAYLKFGRDKRQALAWAKSWLGLDALDPGRLEQVKRQAEANQSARQIQAQAEQVKLRNSAFRMWLEADPRLQGSPVDGYLVGRGIDLSSLGKQPGAIRYHRDLWCVEAKRGLPAMVAAISGADGNFVGCHRTWLAEDGPGRWVKADLTHPKKTLGEWRGGYIRIWRGASRKPMAQAPDGEVVDVTEGIEDGLSVAIAAPECRVIAAVSLDNIGNLVFPPQIDSLMVWRQADTSPAAIAAFDRATRAQLARGLSVVIPAMRPGCKDVNDMLRGERHD